MKLTANDKQLKWYWMGKRPNSRKAVMWYIYHPKGDKNYLPQRILAEIFEVTDVTIRNHLRKMQINGLIKKEQRPIKADYERARASALKTKKAKTLDDWYSQILQTVDQFIPLSKYVEYYQLKAK